MKKFQSFDRHARLENDTVLETIHQNAITCLSIFEGTKGNVTKLSSSGADGQLVIWDLQVFEVLNILNKIQYVSCNNFLRTCCNTVTIFTRFC